MRGAILLLGVAVALGGCQKKKPQPSSSPKDAAAAKPAVYTENITFDESSGADTLARVVARDARPASRAQAAKWLTERARSLDVATRERVRLSLRRNLATEKDLTVRPPLVAAHRMFDALARAPKNPTAYAFLAPVSIAERPRDTELALAARAALSQTLRRKRPRWMTAWPGTEPPAAAQLAAEKLKGLTLETRVTAIDSETKGLGPRTNVSCTVEVIARAFGAGGAVIARSEKKASNQASPMQVRKAQVWCVGEATTYALTEVLRAPALPDKP